MTNVPNSWAVVPISEVLEPNQNGKPFQQGWSPQCENHSASLENWGVLKTTAIQPGQFRDYENKQLPEALEPRPHIEVRAGDLLMTCAGPRSRCGVVCLVERTRPKLMMSGKMYRFRTNSQVMDPHFLTYFIQSRNAQVAIDSMKTGISDSGLNLTHDRFATLAVPVAPPPEQRRIVARIEKLFSELDKGVESLTIAREQIKAYRQAVLKHAFAGKLTSAWRAKNVARITGNLSAGLSFNEQNTESLAALPAGWRYVRLSQLTETNRPITYGVIKLGPDVEQGVPTLRSSDVRKLRIDLESVKRISPAIAGQYRRTVLQGGEVLITVRGTLGGISVVPPSLSGWNISREVAMISTNGDVQPTYLQYMLASPQLEAWFKARLRGVAYTGINLETLRGAPVIMCSVDEQCEIARLIEERISIINSAEQEIEKQLAKVDILRQSILQKAFSGQLVLQNAADEPAPAVLERIGAAGEQHGALKRRNNKNTKKEAA